MKISHLLATLILLLALPTSWASPQESALAVKAKCYVKNIAKDDKFYDQCMKRARNNATFFQLRLKEIVLRASDKKAIDRRTFAWWHLKDLEKRVSSEERSWFKAALNSDMENDIQEFLPLAKKLAYNGDLNVLIRMCNGIITQLETFKKGLK